MNISVRSSVVALALVVGLAATGVASAHDHDNDFEGQATVVGTDTDARWAALHGAIADWKKDVYAHTGKWARWATATEKKTECEIEDRANTKCEVEAIPHH